MPFIRFQESLLFSRTESLEPISHLSNYILDQHCDADNLPTLKTGLQQMYNAIVSFIDRVESTTTSTSVGRIFIPNFESILSYVNVQAHQASVVRDVGGWLLAIKHLIRDRRIVVCISMTAALVNGSCVTERLFDLSDNVLSVESFAGRVSAVPAEFKEFHGFLHVHKLQQLGGTWAPFRTTSNRYGLKRDRRKLHVERLHLPPEESRVMASQTSCTTSGGEATVGKKEVSSSPSVTLTNTGVTTPRTPLTSTPTNTTPVNPIEATTTATANLSFTRKTATGPPVNMNPRDISNRLNNRNNLDF